MRSVVVGDQVQCLVLGCFAVDLTQELQPLDVGVPLQAPTNDLSVQDVQRCKQRGRAMALVVVRHGLRTPFLHRQAWLRAIQSLHLALLVAAQHQRMLGQGHVLRHDVFELVHEPGIARGLEAAQDVRLEAVRVPMPHDRVRCGVRADRRRSRPHAGELRGRARSAAAGDAVFPKETFLHAIRRSLKEKCAMIPLNDEAFAWGARAVASASCLSPRSRPAGQAAWRSQSTSPR